MTIAPIPHSPIIAAQPATGWLNDEDSDHRLRPAFCVYGAMSSL